MKMKKIEFFIHGNPAGKARLQAFRNTRTGKNYVVPKETANTEAWAMAAYMAARQAKGSQPAITGAARVSVHYYIARPKAHYRTGKYSNCLKPSAPEHHIQKPDLDRLDNAIYDALTQAGVWVDDKQATENRVRKRWVECFVDVPGAHVIVWPLEEK